MQDVKTMISGQVSGNQQHAPWGAFLRGSTPKWVKPRPWLSVRKWK